MSWPTIRISLGRQSPAGPGQDTERTWSGWSRLKEALPKAFRQQEFREEEKLSRKYEARGYTNRLSGMAKKGFEVNGKIAGRTTGDVVYGERTASAREKELAWEVGRMMGPAR
jgi:hypothetical protein